MRNEFFAIVFLFFALLAVLGMTGYVMSQKVVNLHAGMKVLEDKKTSYRPILNQITKLQKDKENLEIKLQTIDQLKQGSQLAVRVLDEVAVNTPTKRLWLTSLNQSGNSLRLTGVALDNATVAQYMRQLNQSPFFANTALINSSRTEIAGRTLTSFSLTLRVTTYQERGARE